MTPTSRIQPGAILTLPFWAGGDPGIEDYQYEVEQVTQIEGQPAVATLIMLDVDGARRKDRQGHFRRSRRSEGEILADLAARA